MARWARARGVFALASQKPGALERYRLTRSEADRSAWVVEAGGGRLEGAAALNRVLEKLGGGWRMLALAYRLRPISALEETIYRWFAGRRASFRRFGVTPECDEGGADCE